MANIVEAAGTDVSDGVSFTPMTVMLRVAWANNPLASVTRTVKEFAPMFVSNGVPDKVPFAATESQDGPPVFA